MFTIVNSGRASAAKRNELLIRAAADNRVTEFSVLLQRARATTTTEQEQFDQIVENAFNRGDIAILSIILPHVSDEKIHELFREAEATGRSAFFSVLLPRAAAAMTAEQFDEIAENAFNRGDIAIFSIVLGNVSSSQREYLLERAVAENQIAFVAILMSR